MYRIMRLLLYFDACSYFKLHICSMFRIFVFISPYVLFYSVLTKAYFITLQLDPSMRSVGNSSALTANKNCLVHGVDQGFHNWLLYSGQLSQMMNVKIFQQGEGPVTYHLQLLFYTHTFFIYLYPNLKFLWIRLFTVTIMLYIPQQMLL